MFMHSELVLCITITFLLLIGGDQGSRPNNRPNEKEFNAQLGGNMNLTCDIVGK